MTNALRHSQASKFNALLVFDTREIRLKLQDNGRGFDSARTQDGVGILGIRERARSMGAHCSIESSEGKGAVASFVLPLGKTA